jgi:hypothetical protein
LEEHYSDSSDRDYHDEEREPDGGAVWHSLTYAIDDRPQTGGE